MLPKKQILRSGINSSNRVPHFALQQSCRHDLMRECSQLLPDSSHHKAYAYDECFRCSQAAGKASHSASGPCLKRCNANHDWTRHAACESVILYLLRHISKSILGARTATQLTTAKQADARPKPARPRDVLGAKTSRKRHTEPPPCGACVARLPSTKLPPSTSATQRANLPESSM